MSAPAGQLFADEFHNEFGTWMLGYTPYGGGDYGDVAAGAIARCAGRSSSAGSGRTA